MTDLISLGVLAASVPRDVVDNAIAAQGRSAKRAGGKLPPHVVVYFAMALALFAEEDYEEVMVRLSETLASWGCWDRAWTTPTSGGISQARVRAGRPGVRHGRGPGGRSAHARGVAGPLAADGDRRR